MSSTSFPPLIRWIIIPLIVVVCITAGFIVYQMVKGSSTRTRKVISWIRNPHLHPNWSVNALSRCKPTTPFLFPTEGYIGFLWDDSFRPGHRHQGIDIFTKKASGETPVYASYDGFLTRPPDWQSSLIIRIPRDPLHPDRQIWLYYTHLADAKGNSYILHDFPPGTSDKFITEGTLLGYQGNYSGTVGKPVGVHLHFSIVKDDGKGHFLNELNILNTVDPSPYFDLPLNANTNPGIIPTCDP